MQNMNKLDHIEIFAQRLIEGIFNRLFQVQLHPADLVHHLARAIKEGQAQHSLAQQNLMPNRYHLLLNPRDYAALVGETGYVELVATIGDHLVGLIDESDYQFAGPLQVSLSQDDTLSPGQVEIHTDYAAAATDPVPTERPGADGTEINQIGPIAAKQWGLQLNQHQLMLGQPVVSIGRAPDNDIILDDPSIAHYHAQLRWRDGHYYLCPPAGPANGRWVVTRPGSALALPTDKRMAQKPLIPGQVIRLGNTVLTVIVESKKA